MLPSPLEIDASRVGFIGSPLLFSMDVVSIDGGWDDKTVEEDTAGKDRGMCGGGHMDAAGCGVTAEF